jgi:SsrA-binding protein
MAKGNKKKSPTPEIENRKARHDYHIEDTLEVGIALHGSEVKSIREGKCSIGEGYVRAQLEPLRLEIHGMHVHEYPPAAGANHIPTRTRKLLAHKREIEKLARASLQKGITIVPLKLYFKEGWVKLLIGTARGKSSVDKRQTLKEREAQRDIQRAMSKRV